MTNGCAFALLLFAFFPHESRSEPASDEKMANEAIGAYVLRNPNKRKKLLKKQFEKIVDLATDAPDEVQPATVFFMAGLTYREIHELRNDFDFEVIDVEMKAPQGDRGVVMSIGSGMTDLFARKGTLEERLTFMITSEPEHSVS